MKYGIRALAILAVLLAGMLGMAGCGDDDVPAATTSSSVAVSDSSGSSASTVSSGSVSSGSVSSGTASSGATSSAGGSGVSLPYSQNFDGNASTVPAGCTMVSGAYATYNTTYAVGGSGYSLKLDSAKTIEFPAFAVAAGKLELEGYYNTASGGNSPLVVQAWTGSSWVDVQTITDFPSSTPWSSANRPASQKSVTLPANTTKIRLAFTKTTGNLSLDNIVASTGVPLETDRPVVSITTPSNGATLTSWSLIVGGTASDPGTGASGVKSVHVSINGGAWQTADGTTDWDYDYTVTAAGALTIRAYALDNAGNCSLTNQISVTAPADTTNPEVVVSSPTEAQSITSYNVTVSGTASDSGFSAGLDGVWVQLDSATAVRASGASSWTYTFNNVPEGARTITVYAKDMAGNQSTSVVRNITVAWPPDVTAPVCTIASPAAGSQQNATGFTISGTASDSGADASGVKEVWVRLNGGTWVKATGTTSWSYATGALGEGALSIEAKAVDNASPTGNESIVASRSVTVVTTPVFTENMSLSQTIRDYYRPAYGLSGSALKTALKTIITHTSGVGYTGLWTLYQTSDKAPNGKVWDMYSSTSEDGSTAAYWYTFGTDQCGTYGGESDCYNREHSWPKDNFGGSTSNLPGTDAHHITPTDGKVNGQRSNYPYGEVTSPTWTSQNGSKLGPARSGLGVTGTVFEVIDAYKGDHARMHFYMSVRYYNDSLFQDGGAGGWSYAGAKLKPWYDAMLRTWHANDAVEQKEITRNNAIYASTQGNRNPFIDYPELVDLIDFQN